MYTLLFQVSLLFTFGGLSLASLGVLVVLVACVVLVRCLWPSDTPCSVPQVMQSDDRQRFYRQLYYDMRSPEMRGDQSWDEVAFFFLANIFIITAEAVDGHFPGSSNQGLTIMCRDYNTRHNIFLGLTGMCKLHAHDIFEKTGTYGPYFLPLDREISSTVLMPLSIYGFFKYLIGHLD